MKILIRYPFAVIFVYIAFVLMLFIASSAYYADFSRKKIAHDVVRTYLLSIAELHKYYSKEIVPRAQMAGTEFAANYKAHADRIPFPGTIAMDFGEMLSNAKPGLDTNLYSQYPFPWRIRELDEFERESLTYLKKNTSSSYTQFLSVDGIEIIRYAEPVLMKPDCVACHNRDEFFSDRKWVVGEFRGARQVSIPIALVQSSDKTFYITGAILGLVAAFVGAGLVWPLVVQMRDALYESTELNAELDRRVALRTEELREAKEEAENANNIKSEFLSRMSHEMRTPLHAILGFGQAMESKLKADSNQTSSLQSVGHIVSSGWHLLHLVEDALSLGEIERGNLEVNLSVVSVRNLIDESLIMIEPMCHESQITLVDKTRDLPLPDVVADPIRLKQALINLLTNAVKYNIDQGRIYIDGEPLENRLRLKIQDTGIGIPIEQQHELFRPFSRLGDNTSSIRGVGIGLSITKYLVELMDGNIGFDSVPGEGSVFWIEIPIANETPERVS